KGGFNNITAVIFLTEWFHFPSGSMKPMRPCSMKSICFFQEAGNFIQSIYTFIFWNKTAFHSCKNGHKAKATSTGCNDVFIILRINIIHVDPLSCHSAIRFGAFPEIFKGLMLYEG